jgi:hypothetical protein
MSCRTGRLRGERPLRGRYTLFSVLPLVGSEIVYVSMAPE